MRISYDVYVELGQGSVTDYPIEKQCEEIDRRMTALMQWAKDENCVICNADLSLVLCGGADSWRDWANGVNSENKEIKGHNEEEKHYLDARRDCMKKWIGAVKSWVHVWTRDNGKNPLGLFTLKSSWRFSEYEKEGANVVISLDDLVQAVAKKN